MSGTGKYRQVVDEQDNLLGHKWKEEFEPERDMYRVSALWLRNLRGEVLIAQRHPKKKNGGGLWGPAVAVTLEYDETYEQNIYKEMQEEIGLTNILVVEGKKRLISDNERRYFCTYFYATIDKDEEDFELEEDKVAAVQWVKEKWFRDDVATHPKRYVQGLVSNLDDIMNDCRK